jgi:hypothetical protein
MDFPTSVKLAIYRLTAEHGSPPAQTVVAEAVGAPLAEVRAAYESLAGNRLLVLQADRATIRMAPPFSGVPTQHRVTVAGVRYFANCAWDAFGIMAALGRPSKIHSRCEQSLEPLDLEVDTAAPPESDWVFHCQVPAAHWWDDVVFT